MRCQRLNSHCALKDIFQYFSRKERVEPSVRERRGHKGKKMVIICYLAIKNDQLQPSNNNLRLGGCVCYRSIRNRDN